MEKMIAKVNISVGDCVLEFSGSEAFVQKQIDEFKGLIHGKLKPVKAGKPNSTTHVGKPVEVDETTKDSPFAQYPNVIDFDGEKINILKVDGTNKADKTRNLVRMYVWAKKQDGMNSVSKEELVSLCKNHECFDAPNFKTTLKNTKGIIVEGSSRDYNIRLTTPGTKEVEKIIKTLNEQEN